MITYVIGFKPLNTEKTKKTIMKTILISVLMLFALQSKASVSDTLTDNGLTEMRINNTVYVGRVTSANDSVITIDVVNVIKVDPNNSTVIYVNSNATKIKKAIITDSREPVIEVKYIDLKLNK